MKCYYFQAMLTVFIVLWSCFFVQDALSVNDTKMLEIRSISSSMSPQNKDLEQITKMFWSMWERINSKNNLCARSVQKMMTDILTNREFWKTAEKTINQHFNITYDTKKTTIKINMCNMITKWFTDKDFDTDKLDNTCDRIYNNSVLIWETKFMKTLLETITDYNDIVSASDFNSIEQIFTDDKFNPLNVKYFFQMVKKALTWGGGKLGKISMIVIRKYGINKDKTPQMTLLDNDSNNNNNIDEHFVMPK